jgi:hypothetical protein
MRRILITIFTAVLLSACNLPRATADLTTPPATDIPANPPCYFNWDTKPLADLTGQIQAAIDSAGLKGVTSTAAAFGESCYDSQTNQPLGFGAMETDFSFTVKVSSLDDKDDLGNMLERIMVVLDKFTDGSIQMARPGPVNISFQSGDQAIYLSFLVENGKAARDKGLHGAALLQEFLNK